MSEIIRTPPVGAATVSQTPYSRLRAMAEKHLETAVSQIDNNHYVRHIEIAKVYSNLARAEAEQNKSHALGAVLPMVDRVTRRP